MEGFLLVEDTPDEREDVGTGYHKHLWSITE